ncbi:FkbM family methyltransferase [Rhodobaculum claviforme]|uniref:Glycosyltransferase 2-like domain-containing protein n=1 Tax=Rhodobaculum claviforme TaxID=1549854 RepID=A0A934TM71_9RHOB|nr:FkbM family methyltransferase [Rhodobaculum claviforme]MBK5928432.1 hypothetical protein [Rhodobaculum claviforme]
MPPETARSPVNPAPASPPTPDRAATAPFSVADTLMLRAFGQRLELRAPPDPFLRDDTLWRLRTIYEPALSAQTLPLEGTAVDIGAGFGGFALPFALAFPGWMVWAFEPDPDAFAALQANIAALGLDTVIAVPLAVGAGAPDVAPGIDPMRLGAVLEASDAAALAALYPPRPHNRSRALPAFLQAGPPPSEEFEACALPTLPAATLADLRPQLLKLTAPQAETDILTALHDTPVAHLLGEMWTTPPAWLIHEASADPQAPDAPRHCWLPVAGAPMLALRHTAGPETRRPGLDVVVAMYNARSWIAACVDGILSSPGEGIRALVVDDGSTDGSGDLVRDLYGDNPRVRLLPKANGGCASARNHGRIMSDASHVAFVDADDVPGPGLFSELLELARYTGAEVVQGGFEWLHMDGEAEWREPSYEASDPAFTALPRHRFGAGHFVMVPGAALTAGQPTIWRRVYRRDFLDNRKVWFPEHIRAFDDQIFQLLTLQYARNVPMLPHVQYGYRQHPGQDIRQGDERGFYSLEMFRMMLRRALSEGWNDLPPLLASYVNTVNWTHGGLRPDLRPSFARAAADLWVMMQKSFGPGAFATLAPQPFTLPDMDHHIAEVHRRLAGLGDSYAWAFLDSLDMHAPLVRTTGR